MVTRQKSQSHSGSREKTQYLISKHTIYLTLAKIVAWHLCFSLWPWQSVSVIESMNVRSMHVREDRGRHSTYTCDLKRASRRERLRVCVVTMFFPQEQQWHAGFFVEAAWVWAELLSVSLQALICLRHVPKQLLCKTHPFACCYWKDPLFSLILKPLFHYMLMRFGEEQDTGKRRCVKQTDEERWSAWNRGSKASQSVCLCVRERCLSHWLGSDIKQCSVRSTAQRPL